ncbi:hypothetical protein FRB99_008744 [Tulasnella sp. 403]|nr:hypothetical protein FRB99_008744 [Tulasnella sp. 403]
MGRTSEEKDEKRQALNDVLRDLAEYHIQPNRLSITAGSPVGRGGYGEVRRATLRSAEPPWWFGRNSSAVAVKHFLLKVNLPFLRLSLRFAREMLVWCKLEHPNILKFIGFHMDERSGLAYFVCPWVVNGDITNYLANNPNVDTIEKLRLLQDTAEGLKYLHESVPPICHGDIKAANVLVSEYGHAMLCDFGLAQVIDEEYHSGLTTSDGFKGSIRWCSPEIFEGQPRSTESDVWAWSYLVFEVLTGKIPYHNEKREGTIVLQVMQGLVPQHSDHPEIPEELTTHIDGSLPRIGISNISKPVSKPISDFWNEEANIRIVTSAWKYMECRASSTAKYLAITFQETKQPAHNHLVEIVDANTGANLWHVDASQESDKWLRLDSTAQDVTAVFSADDTHVAIGRRRNARGEIHIYDPATGVLTQVIVLLGPESRGQQVNGFSFLGSDVLVWGADRILRWSKGPWQSDDTFGVDRLFQTTEPESANDIPNSPPAFNYLSHSTFFSMNVLTPHKAFLIKDIMISPDKKYILISYDQIGYKVQSQRRVWKLSDPQERLSADQELVWGDGLMRTASTRPLGFQSDALITVDENVHDQGTHRVWDLENLTLSAFLVWSSLTKEDRYLVPSFGSWLVLAVKGCSRTEALHFCRSPWARKPYLEIRQGQMIYLHEFTWRFEETENLEHCKLECDIIVILREERNRAPVMETWRIATP